MELKLLMQHTRNCGVENLYVIFLDLKKAYYSLDRDRTMAILKGYGVGKNLLAFIKRIWDGDTLVSKQEGFFGVPFDVGRGVRCGDIDSPIIFNIVVDAIIRDIAASGDYDYEVLLKSFYADDGAICDTDPAKVQSLANAFKDRFERVGLEMNDVKTKAMIVEGAKAPKMQSKEAFDRLHTGEGKSSLERKAENVQCRLCGLMLQRQNLEKHQSRKTCESGRMTWATSQENPVNHQSQETHAEPEMEEQLPQEYCVSIDKSCKVDCPVLDCPGRYSNGRYMREHFRDRHPDDTIVVQQEGLYQRCVRCNMFVQNAGTKHQATKTCQKATSRRERQKVATQHAEMKANVVFTVNGKPIEIVEEFVYLGRLVTKDDKDGPAVMRNLARARAKWASMRRFLVRDAADPKTMATFYRTVVLYVLLYGSESWVLTGDLMRQLRSFHRRCCRGLTGEFIRQDEEGEWICPKSEEVLKKAGVLTIEEYIQRRRDTIMKYAETRNIYGKCKSSRKIASNLLWWEVNYYSDDAAEALASQAPDG